MSINRKEFLRRIGISSVGLITSLPLFAKTNNIDQFNLLFIMTDQQRWDALSCAGNKILKTPNIDRLAKEGVYFANAVSQCPVCGPSRSSMLAGSAVSNTKVKSNKEAYKKKESGCMPMKTYDEILDENGYSCEYYGKWHAPVFRGFVYKNPKESPVTMAGKGKTALGIGMGPYYWSYMDKHVPKRELHEGEQYCVYAKRPYKMDPIDRRYDLKPGKKIKGRLRQPDCHGRLDISPEHTITALSARDTLDALKRLKDKPFSLTCSFHFPHPPMTVPDPYYSMYPPEEIDPPVSIDDPMKNSPYKKANSRHRYPEYRDKKKIRYMISNYYGLVSEIDDWVGKILDKLREYGLEEKTLVIFTSDHGEMLGSHGMRDKNIFLEESVHIPLIMKLPKVIKPRTIVEEPVSQINLFATILDYLNSGKHTSDGRSMRGVIDGTDKESWRYAVSEWDRGDSVPNLMVRTRYWKYFCPYTVKSRVMNVLYNLKDDPYEMNNLLGSNPGAAKYKKQAEKMKALLIEWLKSVDSPHLEEIKKRPVI